MKKLNLKAKLLLGIVGVSVLIFGLITGYLSYSAYHSSLELSQEAAKEKMMKYAAEYSKFISAHIDMTRTLSQNFEGYKEKGDVDRETALAMLQRVLEENPFVIDTWTIWESNAFDGKDSLYVNKDGHDETGRFVPCWTKSGGELTLAPCYGYETDEYYLLPKETGEVYVSDPTIYNMNGVDVNMVVITVPVMVDGKFVGAVGLDIDVMSLLEKNAENVLFETGYTKIYSDSGIIIAHPKEENIGTPGEELVGTEGATLLKRIQEEHVTADTLYSSSLGKDAYKIFAKIPLGTLDRFWIMGSTISIQEMTGKAAQVRNIALILLVLGLVGIAVFLYIIIHSIVKTIRATSDHAKKIAEGDLTATVDAKYLARGDEIGVMARAMHEMSEGLRKIVSDIQETSLSVNSASEELSTTASEAAKASEEVAHTIEEIAKGASDQARDTETGSENALVLGDLIEKDQNSIRSLNASSDSVQGLIKDGLKIVGTLEDKTKESSLAGKTIFQSIAKTNKSAEKIGEVSQLIASIAEQTNLLALNAAIEAARAGEAGKGFAVVAEEIRKLAEQSTQSTKEIDQSVKELLSDAKSSVETMEHVSQIIQAQTDSVEKTTVQFHSISSGIQDISSEINGLLHSSEVMATEKDKIVDVMQNLSAIAEENAASTQEASASTEEQSASLQEVANSSDHLAELAETLSQLIKKFKI